MFMHIDRKTERLIVLLDTAMMTWLRERAARSGCSVAELVRRAIQVRMTETGVNRQQWDQIDFGAEIAEQIEAQNQAREDRLKV
jgi:hypothetical protein